MKTNILCVGKIVGGVIDWHVTPPATIEDAYELPDGEIQRLIDEAHDTEDYADYLLDVEWMRGGM